MFDFNLSLLSFQITAMFITAALLPGLRISSLFGAIATVAVLGYVNSQIWDDKLFFLLPTEFSLKTLSLVLVNGVIFFVIAKILPGIEITRISAALSAPIIFTILNFFLIKYQTKLDFFTLIQRAISILSKLKIYFMS